MKNKVKGFHLEREPEPVDLICGMEVDPDSQYRTVFKKRIYVFCSENCLKHFETAPEKYTGH